MIITRMGYAHPSYKISNHFFETLDIGADAEWIASRTGILNRYSVLSPELILKLRQGEENFASLRQQGEIDGVAQLAGAAIANLAEGKHEPDLLVCGTSVPDYFIPANAALIAHHMGYQHTTVMDANTACSSFISNLQMVKALLSSGCYQDALIVNPERYTLRMNYQDRRSCFLFGDGAAAAFCSRDLQASGLRVVDVVLHSDVSGCELVQIPAEGTFFQHGTRVQKFAVTRTCEVSLEMLERHHLRVEDICYFIGHQANLRMLKTVCARLGIRDENHLYNVDQYGNQGGAGCAIVLASHWNRLRQGDYVLISVVGAGLTWGAALCQFQ